MIPRIERWSRFSLVFLLFALSSFAWAGEDKEVKGEDSSQKASEKTSEATDEIVTTTHEILIDGEPVKYRAKAGTIVMKEEDGTPKAKIFFIAYEKIGVEDLEERPIAFAFNGGPGSSSVWLHLGILGPKRVLMDEEGNPPPPPYSLVENEFSLLDRTDLVFIDPVSTGYSRAVPGENPKQFHGVHQDVESVGEFIRLFTTREGRWSSPKFLAGESYGTTRAAGLANYLQDRHGMYLNGLILVSAVLDFQTLRFTEGNDLPYSLFLPSYTATAWYHKKLGEDLQGKQLQEVLDQSQEYALNDYSRILLKGSSLAEDEKEEAVTALANLTGLSEDYVRNSNLRIESQRFFKELLRDEQRTVGRFDSRFKGIDPDAAGETPTYDPSYSVVQGPYTTCLNDYVRTELNFKSDLPYEILTSRVHPWDYDEYENRYVRVSDSLRDAMTKNPHLRVFVASGFYDLATPYVATEYTFDHLGLHETFHENITMEFYQAGHMMYIHKPSLIRLSEDLGRFFEDVLSE